mgnify:CR=1 FL=1
MSEEVNAAPAEGQAAPAPTETSWTSGFDSDMQGYIENKGFKDAGDLANGYRNLEKLRGVPAEQIVQWPTDTGDREQMLPVYAKMGMPEASDGYTRVLDDNFDSNVYSSLADQAHMLGLGDGQFQGLQQTFAEQAQALITQQEEANVTEFDQWQAANSDGFNAAARVMSEVGMSEEQVEGVLNGNKAALYDFLAKVGGRTSESKIIQGEDPGGSAFQMSASAAKTKVAELMGDESFMKQYTSPSKDVRAAAIRRMEELQKVAAG